LNTLACLNLLFASLCWPCDFPRPQSLEKLASKTKAPELVRGQLYFSTLHSLPHFTNLSRETSLPLKIFSTSRLFWSAPACRRFTAACPADKSNPQHLSRGTLSGALFFFSAHSASGVYPDLVGAHSASVSFSCWRLYAIHFPFDFSTGRAHSPQSLRSPCPTKETAMPYSVIKSATPRKPGPV